jgi:hypothetical protein
MRYRDSRIRSCYTCKANLTALQFKSNSRLFDMLEVEILNYVVYDTELAKDGKN